MAKLSQDWMIFNIKLKKVETSAKIANSALLQPVSQSLFVVELQMVAKPLNIILLSVVNNFALLCFLCPDFLNVFYRIQR